jgi:hypothetical protein
VNILGLEVEPPPGSKAVGEPVTSLGVEDHFRRPGCAAGEVDDPRLIAGGWLRFIIAGDFAHPGFKIEPAEFGVTTHLDANAVESPGFAGIFNVGDEGPDTGRFETILDIARRQKYGAGNRNSTELDEAKHGDPPLRNARHDDHDSIASLNAADFKIMSGAAKNTGHLFERQFLVAAGANVEAPEGGVIGPDMGPALDHIRGKVEASRRALDHKVNFNTGNGVLPVSYECNGISPFKKIFFTAQNFLININRMFFSFNHTITLMRGGDVDLDNDTSLSTQSSSDLFKNALFLRRRTQAIPDSNQKYELNEHQCGCKISCAQALPSVDLVVHSGLTVPKLSAELLTNQFRELGNRRIKQDEPQAWLYGQQTDIDRGISSLLSRAESQSAKHLLLIVHEGSMQLVASNLLRDRAIRLNFCLLLEHNIPQCCRYPGAAMTLQSYSWAAFKEGTGVLVDGPYLPDQLKKIQSSAISVAKDLVNESPLYKSDLSAWLTEPAMGGGGRTTAGESLSINARPHSLSGDIDSPLLRLGSRYRV